METTYIADTNISIIPTGMPQFQLPRIDRNIALSNIMASIAMQEAALAHILNADGEKLQLAIALTDPEGVYYTGNYPGPSGPSDALADLLTINNSVSAMVKAVSKFECVLRAKLSDVLGYINPSMYPGNFPEPVDAEEP